MLRASPSLLIPRRARWLRLAVAVYALSGTACLRFGYRSASSPSDGDGERDAGSRDAGPSDGRGGRGGAGGAGGSYAAGKSGSAGSGAAVGGGSGGQGGRASDDSDAGVTDVPNDAGTSASDAAADGGDTTVSPTCPERPGVLFCDGFEDPALTRWSYNVSQNGSVGTTMDLAHVGTTSLLAMTAQASGLTEARYATDVFAHQKSGDAWMRFYDYLPSSVVVMTSFSVGVMSEAVSPFAGFELRVLPTGIDISATGGVFSSMTAFPRDRWVCVEMHVFIDPIAGVYEAYLDGNKVIGSAMMDTTTADGITAAEIGIHYAEPGQGPVSIYVDDVAVGRARIPCD